MKISRPVLAAHIEQLRISYLQPGWPGRLTLVLALMMLGTLGGFAIPMFGALAPAAIIGLLCAMALPALWLTTKEHQFDVVCIGLVLLFLLQDMSTKLTRISITGATQLLLLGLAPIGIPKYINAIKQSSLLAAANILFFLFVLIGVLSSVMGRSTALAASYQIITNCKPILLIALFYGVAWQEKTERIFMGIIKTIWGPMLFLCLFEWIAPTIYSKVFSISATADNAGTVGDLRRATGLFTFPGIQAANAAQLSIFCLLLFLHRTKEKIGHAALAATYAICIIFPLSRGEMISYITCCFMAFTFFKSEGTSKRIALMALAFMLLAPVFYLFFGENIERELNLAGVTRSVGEIDHPRSQITTYGFLLASKFWPLGAGLGTYAGAGAEKFDHSLYEQLGFKKFWWYGKEDFLMDTFWPNPVAEAGYIGAACLLLCFLALFFYAFFKWRQASERAAPYWGTAAAGILFSLINSVSTPSFVEPRTYFFVALFFGLAFNADRKPDNKQAPPYMKASRESLA